MHKKLPKEEAAMLWIVIPALVIGAALLGIGIWRLVVSGNRLWWIMIGGGILLLIVAIVTFTLNAAALRTSPTTSPTGSSPITTGPAPATPGNTAPGYGLPPQPYIPHPSSYQETGTGLHTQTWTIPVVDGSTLVYGGFAIGSESGGVYGAIQGPTTVTLTVTDGFYSVVASEWGQQEYCFRLSQAVQFGWAHAHLYPLPGYSCP